MKKSPFKIAALVIGVILIALILLINIQPPIEKTQEPKKPLINEKNSTAMICKPLTATNESGITRDMSDDDDWIGLKVSPTWQRVSYIYFNGVNGRGSPIQYKWQDDKFARFTTKNIYISDYKSYSNDWLDDEWSFDLNRETLVANAKTFVGKWDWNMKYKDTWQCEIVEHRNLNIEVERGIRMENERRQKIKELKKIEEETQLKKNKI